MNIQKGKIYFDTQEGTYMEAFGPIESQEHFRELTSGQVRVRPPSVMVERLPPDDLFRHPRETFQEQSGKPAIDPRTGITDPDYMLYLETLVKNIKY